MNLFEVSARISGLLAALEGMRAIMETRSGIAEDVAAQGLDYILSATMDNAIDEAGRLASAAHRLALEQIRATG